MPTTEQPESNWHDAGLEVVYQWQALERASTVLDQAAALMKLSDAMGDLKTWLPGWDVDSGTMSWEREGESS